MGSCNYSTHGVRQSSTFAEHSGVFDGQELIFVRFVRLLFLKLNQSQNRKKKFVLGGFLQKPKVHFFEGPKWYFLKVKLQICFSEFGLYCKRKLHANFHTKY